MNSDLAIDELRATALPGDFPQDFASPDGYSLHACANCLRTFRSLPLRQVCRLCKEEG